MVKLCFPDFKKKSMHPESHKNGWRPSNQIGACHFGQLFLCELWTSVILAFYIYVISVLS